MAVRDGGVYRREKGGTEKRVVGPAREQRLGAHAQHPSKAKAPATSKAVAIKPTSVKETSDAATDA